MVNMNTLFRKGYLLAVVMMAANIFIVNEMKASNKKDGNEIEIIDVDQDSSINTGEKASPLKNGLKFVLTFENYFNFFGTLALSVANNYTKWWDYNPGWYGQFGCFGWKSKRFLYDVVQFEFNFNLGRGAFWLIATCFGSYEYIKGTKEPKELTNTAGLIMLKILTEINEKNKTSFCVFYFIFSSLQGFISLHLTLHISNFSISISYDSIIWGGIGMYLGRNDRKEEINTKPIFFNFEESKNNNNNTNNTMPNN